MKITCSCGNEFDFENAANENNEGKLAGFEFGVGENKKCGQYMTIICKKCKNTIVMMNDEDSKDD